jgi:hypothetical protein
MSRRLLILSLFLLGCKDLPAPKPEADPPIHRTAECRWASSKIAIDGRHEESAWDDAQELTGFSAYWDKKPGQTVTSARLLWDNDYLYFAADMEDYDLYADITERNGMLWLNDVFEIFLKPSAGKPGYYEFQVSANNTRLEMFLPSRGAGGYMRFAKLTQIGMESAVRRRGTLNKHHDKDGGWTVEGRIPWSGFKPTGGRPEPGAKWKFALCRFDYSWTLEQPEQTSTAPLTKPDFHRHEEYGELTFVGAAKQ